MRRYHCSLVCCNLLPLLLVISVGSRAQARAGPPEKAAEEQILRDWTTRANRIQSLTIIAEGDGVFAQGHFNSSRSLSPSLSEGEDFPSQDHSYPVEFHLRADFDRGLLWKTRRFDNLFLDSGQLDTRKIAFAFDGERIARVTPKAENPHWNWGEEAPEAEVEIVYLPNSSLSVLIVRSDFPWLFSVGIVPKPATGISPDTFRTYTPISEGDLSVHGMSEIEGRDHVVLRSQSVSRLPGHFYEYYVDTKRQSAVSRWTRYVDGALSEQYDMTHQRVEGMWLPSSWKWMEFKEGGLSKEATLRVASIELNPVLEKQMFVVKPTPESLVADRREGRSTTVVVRGDGVAETLGEALGEAPVAEGDPMASWKMIALAAGLVLALLFVVLLFRRVGFPSRK